MSDTLPPLGRPIPPLVERVRMALAEVGHGGAHIDPYLDRGEESFLWQPDEVPDDIMWRAREVALAQSPICRACWGASPACPADRRLMTHHDPRHGGCP